MGMHNYANFGHVVKAITLAPLLKSDEARHEFREMIETGDDPEDIGEFFAKNMHDGYPVPTFLILNDECESDDMDLNELYAEFAQSDLYVMSRTGEHRGLNIAGIVPQLKQWVTWG